MKYVPILFSTPMVKAILDGSKTQTRRIIKGKTDHFVQIKVGKYGTAIPYVRGGGAQFWAEPCINTKCQIGDIFWVRETWQHTKILNLNAQDENYGFVYRADGQPWKDFEGWTWKPSIFMPKEACRMFLEVVDVRVERLHDISEEDAISEGITEYAYGYWRNYTSSFCGGRPKTDEDFKNPIESFKSLWESINGKESLKSNPWVWVYDFEKTEKPKDF